MPAEDSWFWTVDDLVTEVCHSKALFLATGCAAENGPDPTMLEHQIRTQQITGSAFLTALNTHTLRHELNINQLGQRMAMLSVIELLRQRSFRYKQHSATTGVEALNLNKADHSLHSHSTSNSRDTDFADDTDRKRRKVTHITPLPPTFRDIPGATAGLTAGTVPVPEQAITGGGDWDHLRRWQQLEGDEEADLAAEDEFEEDEQRWPEDVADVADEDAYDAPDEVEEPEGAQGRCKLNSDQVIDIVNERIEFYTNTWKPNKGAIRGEEIDYNPQAMWEEAEATGRRQALVEKYEADLEYYRQRLDRLCEEIVKFPGSNADKVRHQCGNLEVTVDSMELADWLLSIYKLEPVSDSEKELDAQNPSSQYDKPELQPSYPSRSSVEIIDLGSPPESSADEQDAIPSDSPNGPTVDAIGDYFAPPTPLHSPGSHIVETVETLVYADSEPPVLDRALQPCSQVSHNNEPEHASIATVRRWRWTDLVNTQDRKRVVSKAIYELKTEDRQMIRSRLKHVGRANMGREMQACVEMLSKDESKMPGVLPRDLPKIMTFTSLFLSWWLCSDCFREKPPKWRLEELTQCLKEGSPDPSIFYDYLSTIMTTTFSEEALQHPERPSQAEIIEISEDENDNEPPPRFAQQHRRTSNKAPGSQQDFAIILD